MVLHSMRIRGLLRHFYEEAKTGEFWGLDQAEEYIMWNKENLYSPFNFLTVTDQPHLPFEDNKFCLLYGISVFTHIEYHSDNWLMEIRRVLRPGGHAVVTAHNEDAVDYFIEHGRPSWIPEDIDLHEIKKHDVYFISGNEWYGKHIFYKTAYPRKEWGKYFEGGVSIHFTR